MNDLVLIIIIQTWSSENKGGKAVTGQRGRDAVYFI